MACLACAYRVRTRWHLAGEDSVVEEVSIDSGFEVMDEATAAIKIVLTVSSTFLPASLVHDGTTGLDEHTRLFFFGARKMIHSD